MLGQYLGFLYLTYVTFIFWNTIQTADASVQKNGPTVPRMWTEWYNTDHPGIGKGDDELVTSIRKRGYEICGGSAPIDAVCRISQHHVVVFNAATSGFTEDLLAVPCTTVGVLCVNKEQVNRTCWDYDIRFECLDAPEEERQNVVVIGIAAGLSVIIPILCVTVMHIARVCKHQHGRRNDSVSDSSDISGQTDCPDLPPTYSELFGETTSEPVGQNSVISIVNENGQMTPFPNTVLIGQDTVPSIPSANRGTELIDSSSSECVESGPVCTNPGDSYQRFPGMHLSIFDWSQQTTEPRSLQTPPPSYNEAMTILAELIRRSNEPVSTDLKNDSK